MSEDKGAYYKDYESEPTELSASSLSVDTITINGVGYAPTTLSVDGVEYVVLVAAQTEPTEEPTNEDNP